MRVCFENIIFWSLVKISNWIPCSTCGLGLGWWEERKDCKSRELPVVPYRSIRWHQWWPCLRDHSSRMAPVIFSFGADGLHILISGVLNKNFRWILDKAAGYSFMRSTPNNVKKRHARGEKKGRKQKLRDWFEHLRLWHCDTVASLPLNTVSCAKWQELIVPIPFRGRLLQCLVPPRSFGPQQHVYVANRDCLLREKDCLHRQDFSVLIVDFWVTGREFCHWEWN